jgi:hypothetical protein
MKTHGIRISDGRDDVLTVKIEDILQEIKNGSDLKWCILFLDGTPNKGEGILVNEYKCKINGLENGLHLDWREIFLISKKFFQIFEVTILGCKAEKNLHRYSNDQEMYLSCDIVIELIDCAFWQVFSKNTELIKKLKEKFKKTELLETNFKK